MKSSHGLRVLVVTPGLSYPPSDGFSIRVAGLVHELALRHRVTVLAYDHAVGDMAALCDTGVDVRLVSRGNGHYRLWKYLSLISLRSFRSRYYQSAAMQQAIRDALTAEPFDVVQVESTELWAFDFRTPGSGHVVVLDAHNVFSELLKRITRRQEGILRRLFWELDTAKFAREERNCWRRVDGSVMTSEREAEVVRATVGAQASAVVPNAVDVDQFRPTEAALEAGAIVFTGMMSYPPNQDAVRYFVREILPLVVRHRPEVVFTVVGKEVPEDLAALSGPHVRFTGMVPDTRPYLSRAAVVVAPLRAGSGTRLKILEALAMGKGVVSTSIGCEGLNLTPGRELLVADEPDAFAEAVVRLLDDRGEAAALGRRGRELVEASYHWPAAALMLEQFYTQLRTVR
jgi:glycosyltransferase involved in cell wall biosynthesis